MTKSVAYTLISWAMESILAGAQKVFRQYIYAIQILCARARPHTPVSYTHLDVYKRQLLLVTFTINYLLYRKSLKSWKEYSMMKYIPTVVCLITDTVSSENSSTCINLKRGDTFGLSKLNI